jgi:hypothetical protein
MEQMETAAEAKAKRGNKACIRRELQPVVSPATATSRLEQAAIHLLVRVSQSPTHTTWPIDSSSSGPAQVLAVLRACQNALFI